VALPDANAAAVVNLATLQVVKTISVPPAPQEVVIPPGGTGCGRASSCCRFAAERSPALSGLVSGTEKVRSSRSISAMICSASIPSHYLTEPRQRSDGTASNDVSAGACNTQTHSALTSPFAPT
jgi:hypothetical protein